MPRSHWLGLLVAMVGCGTDVTADEACTKVAQTRCSQLQACSTADLDRRWPDLATCESREKLACTEALAAPKTANSPSAVEACASALAHQGCASFLAAVDPPTECLPKDGSLANGMACSYPAQCSSGFCAVGATALCGVCAAPPNPGDSCAVQGCGPTMICVASTKQCQVPVASAGSCSTALPCGQGLACVGATPTANGTCTAQGEAAGAACDQRRMTAADCDPSAGLTCDRVMNVCVMQPLAAANATCGDVNNVDTACSGGATCNRAVGSPTGTCVAPAADSAACESSAGPYCQFPARCVPTTPGGTAGTCQLPGSQSC